MSVQMGHLTLVTSPHAASDGADAAARPAAGEPARSQPVAPAHADIVPASPPPEVLAEVDAAAARAEAMAAADRELHFRKDEQSGRIIVEVRDLEGNVVRTIPASEALDVMSGLREP